MQSDALRRNQTHSAAPDALPQLDAIRRNQTQSDAIRRNQMQSDAIRRTQRHLTLCRGRSEQRVQQAERGPGERGRRREQRDGHGLVWSKEKGIELEGGVKYGAHGGVRRACRRL